MYISLYQCIIPNLVKRFFDFQQACIGFVPMILEICEIINDVDEWSSGGMLCSKTELLRVN